MKYTRIKNKWLIGFGVVILLILIVVLVIFLPLSHKAKAPEVASLENTNSSEISTNSTQNSSQFDTKGSQSTSESSTNQNSSINTADSYYYAGLRDTANKNYSEAIANITKAIELDPQRENYYSKKAEAQVLAGDKKGAIATVEAGLRALPGNELLKNKLDIINQTVK